MGELPLLAGQQPIAEIWSRIWQAAVTMWPKATEQKNPYGFAVKPERVRFRVLDPALSLLPGVTSGDITLDVDSFRALRFGAARIFITENETNFLAFPAVAGSLALFGAGYGFEVLDGNTWLQQCRLYYWGDIDTHVLPSLINCAPAFPTCSPS